VEELLAAEERQSLDYKASSILEIEGIEDIET
jgi:hypothetical protein